MTAYDPLGWTAVMPILWLFGLFATYSAFQRHATAWPVLLRSS